MKLSARWGMLLGMLLIVVSLFSTQTQQEANAQTRDRCSGGSFVINKTLANGANWTLCWEERSSEGIVLRGIRYTPPSGSQISVINQINLAQIHVPYDDNTARFHDLSDYGLGGGHLNNMVAADCPDGTLIQNNSRNVLCATVVPTGYAYKYYAQVKQGSALVLRSVSHIGAYNYVSQWIFHDDATIEPGIGATGKLQKCTNVAKYGWKIDASSCQYGTSHIHNYYWRIDFALGGNTNNVVEQIEFDSSGAAQRNLQLQDYTAETAVKFSPETFRSWRVKNKTVTNADGHPISYELIPNSDHVFRGPTFEPWTNNDVYVTENNPCERWVSHNNGSGCAGDVSGFVNNQTLVDPIVWFGITFHHLPRDEDDPLMSSHWSSFQMVPRDLYAAQQR